MGERAEIELAKLGDAKVRLESERAGLNFKLRSSEEDFSKLRRLNIELESETDALKDKLKKVEKDYSEDRDKIASALVGFEEEMTAAEGKLRGALDDLEKEKSKVQK